MTSTFTQYQTERFTKSPTVFAQRFTQCLIWRRQGYSHTVYAQNLLAWTVSSHANLFHLWLCNLTLKKDVPRSMAKQLAKVLQRRGSRNSAASLWRYTGCDITAKMSVFQIYYLWLTFWWSVMRNNLMYIGFKMSLLNLETHPWNGGIGFWEEFLEHIITTWSDCLWLFVSLCRWHFLFFAWNEVKLPRLHLFGWMYRWSCSA